MTLIEQIKSARRVSTPLIAISTSDPAATMTAVREAFDGGKTPIPLVRWDALNGLLPMNPVGKQALKDLMGDDESEWAGLSSNPGQALAIMANLPGMLRDAGGALQQRGTIVFMLNGQRFFEDRTGSDNAQVLQGIWNLRDLFKSNSRTLVILGPAFTFPPELVQDVIAFDEPLPGEAELKNIVLEQAKSANVTLKDQVVTQAVDAVRSLSAFTAEQVVAMSLSEDGLDVDQLWQRKISVLEQTPGLSVDRGTESFDDIGGLEQFKKFGQQLISSPKCPLVFVRLDEIEKMLGGAGTRGAGDNTGVSQDTLGVILREMEDNDWRGFIALGPAGTGKSLVTKSLANTASKVSGKRVLSIAFDVGATRGSLVGESERKIRAAMKAMKSLAGRGKVCFVATCNKLDVLPPELRRRFRLGLWFFDLPLEEEKDPIWKINLAKYGLKANGKPNDTNWTGADIRNVCDIADILRCSLAEATKYIVPVAKSDPESIDTLRKLADGRFLSASYEGEYQAKGFLAAIKPAAQTGQPSRRARSEEV